MHDEILDCQSTVRHANTFVIRSCHVHDCIIINILPGVICRDYHAPFINDDCFLIGKLLVLSLGISKFLLHHSSQEVFKSTF